MSINGGLNILKAEILKKRKQLEESNVLVSIIFSLFLHLSPVFLFSYL